MIKRLLDLALATAALVVVSPFLLPVMLALRLTGEGEVFYRQQRIGRNGHSFAILKFATMLKNSPNMAGGDISQRGDPRILPFGRFLRATKLNELPQLINVVAGDMSLVGPRPLTPRIAALFAPDHWQKTSRLRPGLSGIGSIVFRDEDRLLAAAADPAAFYRDEIVPHKAALEQWYEQHQTIGLDLTLIALTIGVVVDPRLDVCRHLPGLPPLPAALRLSGVIVGGSSQR